MSATPVAPAAPSAADADATAERKLAVLIVDDHEIVHWGFRLVLSRETWVSRCIGASTPAAALELTKRYEPNVALVDLMLGGTMGTDVSEQIRQVSPSTRILLMSGSGRIGVRAALSVGASGFVAKDRPPAEIVEALHAVGQGRTMFSPQREAPASDLSQRERDVLALVASGATNREIASTVHLSPHTVKEHLTSLYRKLGARNRTDAVQRAQRRGLLA
jgi:DNA-binding NarL/FixJ family response regulator